MRARCRHTGVRKRSRMGAVGPNPEGPYPDGKWDVLERYKDLSECRSAAAAHAQGKGEEVPRIWGDVADPFDPKKPEV